MKGKQIIIQETHLIRWSLHQTHSWTTLYLACFWTVVGGKPGAPGVNPGTSLSKRTRSWWTWRTENVLVSHQYRLVDLGLPEPAGLLSCIKNFYSHFLSSPAAEPHLAVATLSDLTHHLDLFSDGALHLEKKQQHSIGAPTNQESLNKDKQDKACY